MKTWRSSVKQDQPAKTQAFSHLCILRTESAETCHCTQASYMDRWGSKLKSSCLAIKHLSDPSPQPYFWYLWIGNYIICIVRLLSLMNKYWTMKMSKQCRPNVCKEASLFSSYFSSNHFYCLSFYVQPWLYHSVSHLMNFSKLLLFLSHCNVNQELELNLKGIRNLTNMFYFICNILLNYPFIL